MMIADKKLPELLAPAGGMESLEAAIEAGADAVYMGGTRFNARINAANFDDDGIKKAIELCHIFGVKSYITLNIQLYGKELDEALDYARFLYEYGADAIISADLGFACAVHEALPLLELHASTQMSGHSVAEAKYLNKMGFSRMVCARELSEPDIKNLTELSPIETEAFIHGAHCVSHSGQCTASFAMGGRSGNRGECAQPCRLPYNLFGENGYHLSLRDMCLAGHIKALIDCGISSLKIEGRMKSAEYVYGVVKKYRTLIDGQRNATSAEINELSKLFSRGGFTDGYYKNKRDKAMLGIRSESDKATTRNFEKFSGLSKRVPLNLTAELKIGLPSKLTLSDSSGNISVTATGDIPEIAINTPLSAENVKKQLTKFGGTYYSAGNCNIISDDNMILPVSKLNALRRTAIENYINKSTPPLKNIDENLYQIEKNLINSTYESSINSKTNTKSARFVTTEQISDKAAEYFNTIYVPLENFKKSDNVNGIIIPPVIFDSQMEAITSMLKYAKDSGIPYALVGNLGHIELAKSFGFKCVGDFRLNVFNSITAQELYMCDTVILSPELNLRQMREINTDNYKAVIIYGKLPFMLNERCIMREKANGCCQNSDKNYICHTEITDRKFMKMNVFGTFGHRNMIYNSIPIYMADKMLDLIGIADEHHYIFSDESPQEVEKIIQAYKRSYSSGEKIRRL